MPVVSVSQLNNYMKRYVDQNTHLTDLWVCGEISNLKLHYSGHTYMSLKDESSMLKAVMFSSFASNVKFELKNGIRVIAFGKISVYERDGSYQLYIEKIIPDGTGELYAAFEQLKRKLEKAGFFLPERKKAIPPIPKKIGVVTSPVGAAIRDIISVSKRRFPLSDLCIYPAKVQGIGSAESICAGIEYLDNNTDCDVIIISRGGGSIEDLWAFNEEKTAIAIYNCKKPVVSAVGHETDYTIADFVADKRAPTPSAAAEIVLPDRTELNIRIANIVKRTSSSIDKTIAEHYIRMSKCGIGEMYLTEIDFCNRNAILVNKIRETILNQVNSVYNNSANKLVVLNSSLETLNPLNVLKRGYSLISDSDGGYISARDIKKGDTIKVTFNGGNLECNVLEVTYEE